MRGTSGAGTTRLGRAGALAGAAVSAARPHYWIKNLLLFVPLLTAHRFGPSTMLPTAIGAAAFCLVASAGYLLNDVLDRNHDRAHAWKHERAVASGRLVTRQAITVAAVLFVTGLGISAGFLPSGFVVLLAVYALSSLIYSAGLRSVFGFDVAALVATHAVRVFAGGAAAGIAISGWLAGFTVLVFLALAIVKRIAEIATSPAGSTGGGRERPYRPCHQDALVRAANACSIVAVALLGAYVAVQRDSTLYTTPALLWLLCPALLWWMLRLVSKARSGRLAGDPLVSMSRDVPTLATGAGMIAIVAIAARL